MMVHVQVQSAPIGKHRVQCIPLNTYVVDQSCLYVETRDHVFRAVTHVNTVMTVRFSSLCLNSPFLTGRKHYITDSTEVCGVEIDTKVSILNLDVAYP